MQEVRFMAYTAASHQEAIEPLRPHFQGAVMSSIFLYKWSDLKSHFISLFNKENETLEFLVMK